MQKIAHKEALLYDNENRYQWRCHEKRGVK